MDSFPTSPVQRDLDELHRVGIEFHDAIQVHIVDEEDQLLKLADTLFSSTEQQRIAAAMVQVEADMAISPERSG